MKQIITDVENCEKCPFSDWNYNCEGKFIWKCEHGSFDFGEEKIIDDPTKFPDWCPLPDGAEGDFIID